jgi:hypothetical protein
MPRPLLKLGSGSGEILRDVGHLASEAEALIARTKGPHEPGHIGASFQAPKALHGFEHTGRPPTAASSGRHALDTLNEAVRLCALISFT